ncbi:MAG: hypothetical protein FJ263_00610 [Planctomycetes bacterium]|nr:hypothetical protein [Planctomycetota bacterium]
MFKKMIIIAIATAAAVWVFAAPGTWGKETPAAEKEAKAPTVQFGRWLNDFRAAYEQRDGEKMDQLIKGIEARQKEMPAMPQIEKWLGKIKGAYQAQDAKKMGQLLDNADRMREQIRGRIGQNMMARRGRGDENFGERGRRLDGPRGQDFGAPGDRPDFGRQRGYNRQRDNFRSGDTEGRPEQFRFRGGMPGAGEFEGPRAMRRFEPQRPMRFDEYGPQRFAPREPMGYGRMMPRRQDGNERPRGLAPMFNDGPGRHDRRPMNGRFAPRMRPEYGPRYDGPRNYPQDRPSQEYDRTVPRDFWY